MTKKTVACSYHFTSGLPSLLLESLCKPSIRYRKKQSDVTAKIAGSLFGPVIKSRYVVLIVLD